MFKTLAIVLVASCMLAGCATPSAGVVREGSKIATLVALHQIDATADNTRKVKAIALTISQFVNQDGELDGDYIKQEVLKIIESEFEGAERAIILGLADALTEVVLLELSKSVSFDRDVVILVRAAAEGVASGADLYLATLESNNVVGIKRVSAFRQVYNLNLEQESK